MRSIEIFIIFTVRTLDFAIVPRCKRLNELVANAKLLQFHLEQMRLGFIRNELLCKLGSVIYLYALNLEWSGLEDAPERQLRNTSCVPETPPDTASVKIRRLQYTGRTSLPLHLPRCRPLEQILRQSVLSHRESASVRKVFGCIWDLAA